MWKDGFVSYELTEEEYDLLCDTFANEACSWVAYEVRKELGDRVKQFGTYPGVMFTLFNPSSRPEVKAINVSIYPASEQIVRVESLLWAK